MCSISYDNWIILKTRWIIHPQKIFCSYLNLHVHLICHLPRFKTLKTMIVWLVTPIRKYQQNVILRNLPHLSSISKRRVKGASSLSSSSICLTYGYSLLAGKLIHMMNNPSRGAHTCARRALCIQECRFSVAIIKRMYVLFGITLRK